MLGEPKYLAPLLTALIVSTALLADRPSAARADNLDRALLKAAPEILAYLEGKEHKNVAVLKFLVQKGDAAPSDRVGTLNLAIARRLELALVLANKGKKPLNIIQDASKVAADTVGATHRTRAGREKLFEGPYPLAWGNDQVLADAFLTGRVQVNADLTRMTVTIEAFGKDGKDPERVITPTLVVDVDAAVLTELGESFLLRGAFDNGKAVEAAAKVKTAPDKHPLADRTAPVSLEITYDGRPVRTEVKDGIVQVPEPKKGEKVAMVVRRLDRSRETYGVVLKINGENTLFRQRLPDLRCRKWVLEPSDPSTPLILGYRTADDKVETFQVESREESKADAIDYGPDVGTITMTVYRRKPDGTPADPAGPKKGDGTIDEADELAVQRGAYPTTKPESLAALQSALRQQTATRGRIRPGEKIPQSELKRVPFEPDPVPVMAVTVRYFKP